MILLILLNKTKTKNQKPLNESTTTQTQAKDEAENKILKKTTKPHNNLLKLH